MSKLSLHISRSLTLLLLLSSSLLGTLFLFFIDEGNYHFNNLLTQHNIIALSFYFVGIFLTQLILYLVLKERIHLVKTIVWSVVIGFPLGSILTAVLILGLQAQLKP